MPKNNPKPLKTYRRILPQFCRLISLRNRRSITANLEQRHRCSGEARQAIDEDAIRFANAGPPAN